MPWRIRAPATAFLLTPKASAMRDIGMPSAESSRSLVIAGSSQVMCQVGQFVGRRGASCRYPSVLRGCPLLTFVMPAAHRTHRWDHPTREHPAMVSTHSSLAIAPDDGLIVSDIFVLTVPIAAPTNARLSPLHARMSSPHSAHRERSFRRPR